MHGSEPLMLNLRTFLITIAIIITTGCFKPYWYEARLYDLASPKVLKCAFHRLRPGNVDIQAIGPSGENFTGQGITQSERSASYSLGSGEATAFHEGESVTLWAQSSGFTFNDPGMQYGSFLLVGDRGTVIDGVWKVNPYDSHGGYTGVARSNHGDHYRLFANYKEKSSREAILGIP